MIDLEGNILMSREDLVDLMSKEKSGEEVERPEFVKVMDIIDENEKMPEEF